MDFAEVSSIVDATSGVRIRVLHGPGLELDFPRLRERLHTMAASREPAPVLEHAVCESEGDLVDQIRAWAVAGDGLIVSPGALVASPQLAAAAIEAARAIPTVWVEIDADASLREPQLSPLRIHGRGIDGFLFALASIVSQIAAPREIVRYGALGDQFAILRVPAGPGPHPVVALLHGGGWRDIWGLDRTEAIAGDLLRRGYATWNIEFRRIGANREHWRETFDDVAAAIDTLENLRSSHALDLARFVVIGHSSGGHLALWAAARQRLGDGAPGARPRVVPVYVVSLAGLGDLAAFARRGIDSNSAVLLVNGTPEEVPERYDSTSPRRLLPLGIPQLLVHAARGSSQDLNDLAHVYRDAARAAGDSVHLVELDGVDHPGLIDPSSAAWRWVASELERHVPPASAGRFLTDGGRW